MQSKSFSITVKSKIKPFKKIIKVDADKSLSIRSFLISSISHDVSSINNILESEDVKSTIQACKKLGVKIVRFKTGSYKVFGKGLGSLLAKKNLTIDCGNSGTLARLLIGILSTTPDIEINITGDKSLKKRSMKKLINLMSEFGATFLPKGKYNFPLKLISSEMPIGIHYKSGVSAQLKSAVILAGLNSYGNTEILEKTLSRDHTENMLLNNKQVIKIKKNKEKKIIVFGKKFLKSIHTQVSGDPSSASFFVALTLLNKNSSIKIKNVGLNPTRTGFFQLLKKQGVKIQYKNLKKEHGELRGDVNVKSYNLKPIKASGDLYSLMVDEYPILFVMAALTKGISSFKNIGDLASKESNRITEMQKVLKQVGVKSTFSNNQLKIFGKGMIDARNKIVKIPDLGDHRICMSSFILAVLTGAKTKIKNFSTVFTSSPSFLKIMKSLGANYEIQK